MFTTNLKQTGVFMRAKSVESIRKTLVVVGLISLVVVGFMAAGQARDMRLAGAVQHKISSTKNNLLRSLGADTGVDPAPNPSAAVVPETKAVNDGEAKSKNKPAVDVSPTSPSGKTNSSTNANPNSLKNTVNKVTEDVNKSAEKVQNQVDDLNRIWP